MQEALSDFRILRSWHRFTLQCPGYIVKAALCRIRGSQVELLETYGANVRDLTALSSTILADQNLLSRPAKNPGLRIQFHSPKRFPASIRHGRPHNHG